MRLFTLEKAEKLIPKIARLVKRAQRLQGRIACLVELHDASVEINTDDGFHYFMTPELGVNKEFHRYYYQFYKALEDIALMGAFLRDLEDGIVDFPCEINGKDAFYCWQMGEIRISHWHGLDECFDERHPILDMDELLGSE
ncbi:DUF2203 domain-containing protein [Candidatus Woesearchaeota archaeon]|nr:DUF2203 domain-containing protein [Candidatus Woesearchaeota archaeon]